MSGTTPTPPVPIASVPWFDSLKLAASSIYHKVLSFETNVSAWVEAAETNPAVKKLIDDGVDLFESMVGLSPAAVNVAMTSAKALLAMLSQMAASDPTVQSGSSPSTVIQPPIPAPPAVTIVQP